MVDKLLVEKIWIGYLRFIGIPATFYWHSCYMNVDKPASVESQENTLCGIVVVEVEFIVMRCCIPVCDACDAFKIVL